MATEKLPSYGGQALIEGVLMRGSNHLAAAFRAPDGSIVVEAEELTGIYQSGIKKIPFLRGLILLWDALGLGIRYLTLSANIQTGEDEKIEGPTLFLTLAVSLLVGVGLFFALPAGIGQLTEHYLGFSSWASNLLEGILRLFAVVAYIWGIGKMPEIRRVFQYHGAEHKTINAFEDGAELTPEVVSGYSLEHPRCGTAFLLTLVLFSVVFFALLGPLPPFWRIATRVIFIPVLAGFAYEYIRFTANHLSSPIIRQLIRPNLALQRLTTVEPDLSILEVAITAFQAMYARETGSPIPVATLQPSAEPVLAAEGDYRSQQK
jgi:uncharacterized protein YqhQ